MATILKRFLALHATRAASSSVDPKDSQVGLALGLQALSSLCVSERSEASVGEGNKAADLVIKEGLAEHIIQALKTYNQVHTHTHSHTQRKGGRGHRASTVWEGAAGEMCVCGFSLPLGLFRLSLCAASFLTPLCACARACGM
jgi:hypothetical protein